MPRSLHDHASSAACRFAVWYLLVALPLFGVSSTLVQLLGPLHSHRTALVATAADPMQGWVDLRRGPGLTTVRPVHPHPHSHSHGWFARHHHDRGDADVIALDAGLLQGDAAEDGGASTFIHLMAMGDGVAFGVPPALRFAWRPAADAAALPWTADGPLRPPKT